MKFVIYIFIFLQSYANAYAAAPCYDYFYPDNEIKFNDCKEKAKQGSMTAQDLLGVMYLNGQGVSQNYKEALRWFSKAAQQDYSRGYYHLGKLYQSGKGVSQNYKQAINWFEKASEQWDEEALFELGKMYQQGQGIPPNNLKSYRYYQMAVMLDGRGSDFGGPGTRFQSFRDQIAKKLTLSQIRKEKIDVYEWLRQMEQRIYPEDNAYDNWLYAEIRRKVQADNNRITSSLYRYAAEHGNCDAQRILVKIFQQSNSLFAYDDERDFKYYKSNVQQLQSGNQLNLAYMHFHGKETPQDKQKALYWYKKAAETKQGEEHNGFNTMAMYLVAWMYDTAQGIPQDYKQAFDWYQQAANAGYGDAQLRLADMYQQGQGVEQNNKKALHWYKTAAEQGYNKAQRILADLYRTGTLLKQDKRQAFNWYQKAAMLEDTTAQYALAQMYATGQGTTKDNIKAYILSAYLAENYHHENAKTLCQQLEKQLNQTELKQANELGKQWQADSKYRTLGVAVAPPFEW